jgi:hypothetical protein
LPLPLPFFPPPCPLNSRPSIRGVYVFAPQEVHMARESTYFIDLLLELGL